MRRSQGFKELKAEPDLLLEIIMRQPGSMGAGVMSAAAAAATGAGGGAGAGGSNSKDADTDDESDGYEART